MLSLINLKPYYFLYAYLKDKGIELPQFDSVELQKVGESFIGDEIKLYVEIIDISNSIVAQCLSKNEAETELLKPFGKGSMIVSITNSLSELEQYKIKVGDSIELTGIISSVSGIVITLKVNAISL